MRDTINKLSNIFTKPLLRSPLHFLMSGHVLLLTFTGRKSGRRYSTTAEYMREGNTLTLFTQRQRLWWKNFQGGAAVTVHLRGHEISGQAEAFTDEQMITTAFTRMHSRLAAAQVPGFAARMVMVRIVLVEAKQPTPRQNTI